MDVHIALHCIPDVRSMVLPPENWFYRWDQDGIWSVDARALYCTAESLGTILVAWGLRSVLRRFWVQLKAKWPRSDEWRLLSSLQLYGFVFWAFFSFPFLPRIENRYEGIQLSSRRRSRWMQCDKSFKRGWTTPINVPWNAFPPVGCASGGFNIWLPH